jgi:hypothetical protein
VPDDAWLTYGQVSGRADEVLTDLAIDVHGEAPALRDTGATSLSGLVLDAVPLPEPGPSRTWTAVAILGGILVLVGVGAAVRQIER